MQELFLGALGVNGEAIPLHFHSLLPRSKGSNEAKLFDVLRDVDKAPRSHHTVVEAMGIDIPQAVHLGKAQHCHIQCAAIVKLQNVRHPVHGLRIDGRAKVNPSQRNPSQRTALQRQCK